MSDPEIVPAPPAVPLASAVCPECGAEFEGVSVLHASETLAAMREQVSTLTRELAAEKAKHPEPAPAPAPPDPAPAPAPDPPAQKKHKGGMLFGKKRKHRAA